MNQTATMDFVADTEDVARILSGIAAMKAIKIIKTGQTLNIINMAF